MDAGLSSLLREALADPSTIPGFLRRKRAEFTIALRNIGVPTQSEKIDDLLEEGEFLLVILDSCRYDAFEDCQPDFFSGDLQKVYSTNTYTKQYQRSTWPATYDVTYVAGAPVISDRNFELADLDYRPSEHFAEIVDAWDMGYEKELGVTPPEAVTKVALECDAPRMVVHYFQPHAPYIGEFRLREERYEAGTGRKSQIDTRVESLKDVYERIRSGDIDEATLRRAYRSNLSRVMTAVAHLVDGTSRRTVISSDHGELLGEDDRFLHGGLPHPVLCELPWFEVDGVTISPGELEAAISGSDEADVTDQLRDLGYL